MANVSATIIQPLHHVVVLVLSGCLQAHFWNPWASILNCVLQYFETANPCCFVADIQIVTNRIFIAK